MEDKETRAQWVLGGREKKVLLEIVGLFFGQESKATNRL